MTKIQAYQLLQKSGKRIFTTSDLRNIFGVRNVDTLNKQIRGLIDVGILERVIKGYYLITSDQPAAFELANILYRPSYISLESALNYYGILIQTPQEITSITTKPANYFEQDGKRFSYSHIDLKYFSGYQKVENYLIATPEKALVDIIYFAALGRVSLSLEELNLKIINKTKVKQLAAMIINRAFRKYFTSIQL